MHYAIYIIHRLEYVHNEVFNVHCTMYIVQCTLFLTSLVDLGTVDRDNVQQCTLYTISAVFSWITLLITRKPIVNLIM